jgi:hypothetical protein
MANSSILALDVPQLHPIDLVNHFLHLAVELILKDYNFGLNVRPLLDLLRQFIELLMQLSQILNDLLLVKFFKLDFPEGGRRSNVLLAVGVVLEMVYLHFGLDLLIKLTASVP